jgi:tetratricopeptide (TPR) repeat protein
MREAIELKQEMQRLTEPQAQIVNIWVLLSIADGYEMLGEAQRALSLLDQWRAVRDKLELGMRDSFYYRLRARLFLQSGADEEAEKTFRKAIEAAVVRNARSEELRSTLYLARLLMKHRRGDEARAMLAAIYGWFTEGFGTADLKEAKALLEELSS